MELLGSMQRDLMPSLVRMHEGDDLRVLDSVLLQVLERGGEPTVKQLAEVLGRSLSRTSRIVDGLVRRGFAERYEDPVDRRVRRVRLTEAGAGVLRRLRMVRVRAQLELWGHLTAGEREIVMQGMELYAKAARRIRDERDRSGEDRREHGRPGRREGGRPGRDDQGG
ncbi:MarR family winged helix-turn-helix transcriptional regulator [Pseudonocardia acaciae]|uniref:MarR family winged helix-turn-helix transcriptional regulator n=1 Tax=Pseudonocardia acaciae TaxID=551276 RepID=UPI001B805EC6|nr:MarR family winged helix-turn-helix transcriptional regulator [Pseudonocardia acaciae]